MRLASILTSVALAAVSPYAYVTLRDPGPPPHKQTVFHHSVACVDLDSDRIKCGCEIVDLKLLQKSRVQQRAIRDLKFR